MGKGPSTRPFSGLTPRDRKNERQISNMRSFSSRLRFCLSSQGNSVRTRLPSTANQLRCPMCNSICLSKGPRGRSSWRTANPCPVGTSCGSDSATEETTQFSTPSAPEQMLSKGMWSIGPPHSPSEWHFLGPRHHPSPTPKNQMVRMPRGLSCHPAGGWTDNSVIPAGPAAITHMWLT